MNEMKIKLYRHTIKQTECLWDSIEGCVIDNIITYYQTAWNSVYAYFPKNGNEVIKIEEKEVVIENEQDNTRITK